MSSISGGSNNDGEFVDLIVDRSMTLRSKYTLPLDAPVATNYFIKSDGTSQLVWADAAAAELGNVNFSGVSVISGNIPSFNGTSGTEIIDSGIASSNILTNPMGQNLNLDGNSIININENIYTAKASGITPAIGELTMYASNVDGEFHQIDENGIDTVLGGETFDQNLNTTDAVEFLSVATDTITEQTVGAGTTVEGTLFKDGNIESIVKITDGDTYIYTFQYGQKVSARFDNSSGGVIDLNNRARGTLTAPTALLSGDLIGIQYMQGHDGTSYDVGAIIKAGCSENWSPGNAGSFYTIQVNNTGTTTLLDKLIIADDIQVLNANLLLNANNISNVGTIDTNILTVGNTGVEFTLPSARSLTTNQVLKDVLGNGVVSWETELASSETLQEAFDAGQQILTSVGKDTLVIKQGVGAGDNLFEIKDSADTLNLTIQKNGSIISEGSIIASATVQGLDVKATGTLAIGNGVGNVYNLPDNRTTATDGAMLVLNDSTDYIEFRKPLYLYNFTQNFTTSNISGTINEIDMTSAIGNGTLTILANELVAGATFHFKCGGTIENATNNDELRLKVYLGTSVVIDTGVMDLPKIAALEPWIFEADITFRTIGATATSIFNGQFSFNDAGSYLGTNVVGAGATVDLTANQTWQATSQWSNASVTNQLYTQILYFYRIS